ncbi:MAG: hypothetical protein QXT77_07625, partial [Candidatus Methanomethylicaceae archaeon]
MFLYPWFDLTTHVWMRTQAATLVQLYETRPVSFFSEAERFFYVPIWQPFALEEPRGRGKLFHQATPLYLSVVVQREPYSEPGRVSFVPLVFSSFS